MAQITESSAAPRRGLLRRILLGEHISTAIPYPIAAPDVVDLAGGASVDWEAAWARIGRLEDATRLLAQTLRRTYTRLSRDMGELRRQVGDGANGEVEARVSEALRPVEATLSELAAVVARLVPEPSTVELDPAEEPSDALTALRRSRLGTGALVES